MQLNYFSEISVNPFKNVVPDLYNQQIHSLWNGSSIKNIIFNTFNKSKSSLNSFFSQSLTYSLSQAKEIQNDLAINPISEQFSTTVKSSKFNIKKFLTIGVVTIGLQFLGTALHNNNNNEDYIQANLHTTQSSQIINTSSNSNYFNIDSTINDSFYQQNFSNFVKQSLSNPNPVETLKTEIPKTVVKIPKYMQSMFTSKNDAFLHLLKVAEGKQDKFYRDNKGIAIAYGWNPTRNTKDFNLAVAQKAGLNDEQIAAIIKVSDTHKVNYVPKELRKIKLSSQQIDQTALALMPNYEQQFLDAMIYNSARNGRNPDNDIEAYHQLPNNQQAVMIHMAYKVGGDNLLNYKTFYKKLFKYIDNPNKVNMNQVQQNFQYTYSTLDGQKLHDSRVESIHTGFFSDCSINSNPNLKDKVVSKINQCRNIANITDYTEVQEIKTNVATIQSKMSKIFG